MSQWDVRWNRGRGPCYLALPFYQQEDQARQFFEGVCEGLFHFHDSWAELRADGEVIERWNEGGAAAELVWSRRDVGGE